MSKIIVLKSVNIFCIRCDALYWIDFQVLIFDSELYLHFGSCSVLFLINLMNV